MGINTQKTETENWSFPEKIDLLNYLGIVSPEILRNINQRRNDLEHRYSKPEENEVKQAWDIAHLFIKYTEKYLNAMPYEGSLRESGNIDSILEVELDYKNRKIRFECKEVSKDHNSITSIYIKEIPETNRDEYRKYLMVFKNNRYGISIVSLILIPRPSMF